MGHKIKCEVCRGSGDSWSVNGGIVRCDFCKGRGWEKVDCATCHDEGTIAPAKHPDWWGRQGYDGFDSTRSCEDCAYSDSPAGCTVCDERGWVDEYCNRGEHFIEDGDDVFVGDGEVYCDSHADLRCPDCTPPEVTTFRLKGPHMGPVCIKVERVAEDRDDTDTLWTAQYLTLREDLVDAVAEIIVDAEMEARSPRDAYDALTARLGLLLYPDTLRAYPDHAYTMSEYRKCIDNAQRLGL